MKLRRTLSLIGVILLVIGTMIPIIKESGHSTILYSGSGRMTIGYSYLIFLLLAMGFLIATNRDDLIWYLGLVTLVLLGNDLRLVKTAIDKSEDTSYSLYWGWGFLFYGAAILVCTIVLTDVWDLIMPQHDLLSDETTAP